MGLLGWIISCSCFAASSPLKVRVADLQGKAWSMHADKRVELRSGAEVLVGDRVGTEAGARMKLVLGRTIALLVKESSEFVIQAGKDGDWSLKLEKGMVLSAVRNPRKKASPFEIRTRTAVMGVRGTVFFVKAEPGKPEFLCTCNGTVEVSAVDGKSARAITCTHHDSPVWVGEGSGDIGARLKPAPMGHDHADPEGAELLELLR